MVCLFVEQQQGVHLKDNSTYDNSTYDNETALSIRKTVKESGEHLVYGQKASKQSWL